MLTKYILTINGQRTELEPGDLKNWADVKCSCKRDGYSGVVRSFTSKFEFCNNAYRLIMAEFERVGFAANVSLTLRLIQDDWSYTDEFTAPLDFSTLSHTDTVLSLSSVDNSSAAKIKANKSTKYEFIVGEDIPVSFPYMFDRVIVTETASYEITDGSSDDDGALTGEYIPADNNERLYMGKVGDEIGVGGVMMPNEDQEYDGCMVKAISAANVHLKYNIVVGYEYGTAPLVLMKNDTAIATLCDETRGKLPWRTNNWNSIDDVMNYINSDPYLAHEWANESWLGDWIIVNGIVWEAEADMGGNAWVNTGKTRREYVSLVRSGELDFSVIKGDRIWLKFDCADKRRYKYMSSLLEFSWQARGSVVAIDTIDPEELLECLLIKMGTSLDVEISQYDTRITDTLLLAGECVRGIPGAKICASFNDFCNWMETVFGYTYELDDENSLISFKHRKEIFNERNPQFHIENAVDFECKVENSVLYSKVIAGYNRKEYEGVNGRDEFNFGNTYTTGYTVTDKKLELRSPFRADSYGLEFNVEKRGESTTDGDSDQDVFFVLGNLDGDTYRTVRSVPITNSLTGTLINAEFSPVRCIYANADYISLMAYSLYLQFASSEGNSDIIIDGQRMSDEVDLEDCEMLTAWELKFTCGETTLPQNMNALVSVKGRDYTYTGFIKEVSQRYADPEAVDVTLMVKTKTPCS